MFQRMRFAFSMTYTASEMSDKILSSFQQLDVDEQLALFYFIYKEMGGSITPAAPGASTASPAVAEGIFGQIKELSQQEQLQLQRDLIARKDTTITREYGALSDTTKLLVWYLLAQGMDEGTIISMPSEYQLSDAAEEVFGQVRALEFSQQMTLFRDFVSPMGFDSTTGNL
jgi:hypothetical protein